MGTTFKMTPGTTVDDANVYADWLLDQGEDRVANRWRLCAVVQSHVESGWALWGTELIWHIGQEQGWCFDHEGESFRLEMTFHLKSVDCRLLVRIPVRIPDSEKQWFEQGRCTIRRSNPNCRIAASKLIAYIPG